MLFNLYFQFPLNPLGDTFVYPDPSEIPAHTRIVEIIIEFEVTDVDYTFCDLYIRACASKSKKREMCVILTIVEAARVLEMKSRCGSARGK